MKSILCANDLDTVEESIVAIPLTLRILKDALKWLKGTTNALEHGRIDTLEGSVNACLDCLSEVFPAGTDVSKLQNFIDAHQWPEGSVEEMEEELKKKLPQQWGKYSSCASKGDKE